MTDERNMLDGILAGCHLAAYSEVKVLLESLSPTRDLTAAEMIGLLAILRAAKERKKPPPTTKKPRHDGERPRLVRIA